MPSYKYTSFKFNYTNDALQDKVEVQRAYKDADEQYLTIITSKFLLRVINTPYKVLPREVALRFMENTLTIPTTGKTGIFKSVIPYNPSDLNHKEHIEEVLLSEKLLCSDYYGESFNGEDL
jgi:hypothetical protein